MLDAAAADAEAHGAGRGRRATPAPPRRGRARRRRWPRRAPRPSAGGQHGPYPVLERRQLGRGDDVGERPHPGGQLAGGERDQHERLGAGPQQLGGGRALGGKHVVGLVDDEPVGQPGRSSGRWPPWPAPSSRRRPSRQRLIALRSSTRLVAGGGGAGRPRRASAARARPCRRTRRRLAARPASGSRPRDRAAAASARPRATRSASTPVSVLLPLPEGPTMSRPRAVRGHGHGGAVGRARPAAGRWRVRRGTRSTRSLSRCSSMNSTTPAAAVRG